MLACALGESSEDSSRRHKFRGIGGATVILDSIGNHRFFTITTESGRVIAEPARLSKKVIVHLSYSDNVFSIPTSVRFVWREGDVRIGRQRDDNGRYGPSRRMGGTIVGDYTIPVAARIPDEVLDEIRANGGGLRLKFRVHDHGVFLGWDIERRPGYKPGAMYDPARPGFIRHFPAEHHLAGGDFREARIFNGKPVRMGWYIDKDGKRIETDF